MIVSWFIYGVLGARIAICRGKCPPPQSVYLSAHLARIYPQLGKYEGTNKRGNNAWKSVYKEQFEPNAQVKQEEWWGSQTDICQENRNWEAKKCDVLNKLHQIYFNQQQQIVNENP